MGSWTIWRPVKKSWKKPNCAVAVVACECGHHKKTFLELQPGTVLLLVEKALGECPKACTRDCMTVTIPGCLTSLKAANTQQSMSLGDARASRFCLRKNRLTAANWLSAWLSPPTTAKVLCVTLAAGFLRLASSDGNRTLPGWRWMLAPSDASRNRTLPG